MSIEDKVSELLPDLEDYLDLERVKKIDEATDTTGVLKANLAEVGRQMQRNRRIVDEAIKDLVRRDSRKALVALEWLSELVGDIHADLES